MKCNVLGSILLVMLLLGGCTRVMAEEQASRENRIAYGKPQSLGTLANRMVRESSGVCWDATSGVFWTHNDSGGGAALYAFDATGRNHGRFILPRTTNHDWEDIAAAKIDGQQRLIIADTGDNDVRRDTVNLYIVAPPKLDLEKPMRGGNLESVMKIPFRYDSGPVDCEAIAYDPRNRSVILISKLLGFWCKAYELKLPDKQPDKPLVAKKIADVELTVVTGMDISPDGRRLIAQTYKSAYEFVRGEKQTWTDALEDLPRRINMPQRKLGESICYGQDGQTLYLTSEGNPCPLWMVPVVEEKKDEKQGAVESSRRTTEYEEDTRQGAVESSRRTTEYEEDTRKGAVESSRRTTEYEKDTRQGAVESSTCREQGRTKRAIDPFAARL